ncbi:hypothetical protein DID88_001151 [Monilinia fructigena]|uniref:Uncharacterized protein n=1 Tax=Monilinia fructigena TaxID=38457 RepID=A0A395IYV2_9HELO|nr:hypothetical protein DID88_001151 [Monilinia fructigena]
MGRRPGRAAAKNAAAALKNTPQTYDDAEDDHITDAPLSDPGTPPENDEDDHGEEEEPVDSEVEEEVPATPVPETTIRRKRLGRPPKIKPPGWDLDDGTASEAPTPSRGRDQFSANSALRLLLVARELQMIIEVAKAREEGVEEGSLADPNDAFKDGEAYNKNQYVAWHGASSVYHSGQPTVPQITGKMIDGKKRKIMVNDVNWMLEHAREASRFNSAISAARRQNLNGGNVNGSGVAGDDFIGMDGLCGVSEDVLAVLPEDCRKAFEEARERERKWKRQWGDGEFGWG